MSIRALDLVNLERYPIDDLQSDLAKKVIENCRSQLQKNGACALPGFLKKSVMDSMVEESEKLASKSRRSLWFLNTYTNDDDTSLPENHPRRRWFPSSLCTVAYDQIPTEDKIYILYNCNALTEFIAAALGLEKIYRFADEFQALNVTYMGDGDQLSWHYDLNDFVVTLLLQEPLSGGEFEYAANLRNKDAGEENYDDVAKVYNGSSSHLQIMKQQAGTLVLFQGINSLHRVRCTYGKKKRITTILGYHKNPDYKATNEVNVYLYGPRVQKILEERGVSFDKN
ncbi:HalD/BesD family halogenase [Candidatus Uabimicrobium amorphum]|uniref:Fe2OG dioxygenase domain-containing protein n=1 Tax=Uabimicrobium amorphum TaxID=2596890 RepID=A0A5S9F7M1_UABAM|nr:hypothetical protein [Candidatus Uabimicrobium amorphum]BBM87784.1 hypothetical protein UABAM_06199 [Candidatus Uabimicrobium amorphum]